MVVVLVVEFVVVVNVHTHPLLALQSAELSKLAHAHAYVLGVTVVCVDANMTISPIMNICFIIFMK